MNVLKGNKIIKKNSKVKAYNYNYLFILYTIYLVKTLVYLMDRIFRNIHKSCLASCLLIMLFKTEIPE